MFGKGIYFADMVSKSANYCGTNSQHNTGLMLLCDVALGNMYVLNLASYLKYFIYYPCFFLKNWNNYKFPVC